MTKDRLGELLKHQKKKDVTVEIENDTINKKNSTNLKKTFERAEVIGQWIGGIETNLQDIKQYIGKLCDLTVNQKDLNEKIQTLFHNNNSICHRINAKLKEIEEELKVINLETAEGRIKSMQYNTLKIRYTNTFKQNNVELENYRNIQKANLEIQLRAKGVKVTDEELVALLDEKSDIQLFTENIIAETLEAKRILADIEERHQQLLKIEVMLIEVRDLFLQMAILVEEQQELTDRIEYHAELAKSFVGKTPTILNDAAVKKKRHLKCKIYMGIAFVVFVLIILILLLN